MRRTVEGWVPAFAATLGVGLTPYRSESTARYSAVISSTLAFTSGESGVAPARLSLSCSGRLAPMMGQVMAGLEATQATARVARLIPASAATPRNASTVANWRSCQ